MVLLLFRRTGILILLSLLFLPLTGCGTTPELFGVTITWEDGGYVEEKVNGEWVEAESERSVEASTSIQLRAVANTDYEFTSWEVAGADHGELNNEEITVTNFTEGALIKANFCETAPEEFEVTITWTDGGVVEENVNGEWVEAEPERSVEANTLIQLRAVASPDYEFTGWDVTGAGHGDLSNEEITVTHFTDDASIKAGFAEYLDVFLVHDAHDLHDALDVQDQYDVIRLGSDILTGVDFHVILSSHGLRLDLNGYKLALDESNFIIEGDNITVRGSEIELEGWGEFLIQGHDIALEGLTLTTADEDLYIDTGGEVKLTITDSDIFLGGGDFYLDAEEIDDNEVVLYINGSSFTAESFYVDCYEGDNSEIFIDISNSEFYLNGESVIDPAGNETELEMTVSSSQFELGGRFIVYGDKAHQELAIEIISTDFALEDGDFHIDASGNYGNIAIEITGCVFELKDGCFRYRTDGTDDVSSITIVNSTFDLKEDNLRIEADAGGVELKLEIDNSDFDLGGNDLLILAGDADDVDVDIFSCKFEEVQLFEIHAEEADFSDITFIEIYNFSVLEGTTLEIHDATHDGDPIDKQGDFYDAIIENVSTFLHAVIIIYWEGEEIDRIEG